MQAYCASRERNHVYLEIEQMWKAVRSNGTFNGRGANYYQVIEVCVLKASVELTSSTRNIQRVLLDK